MKVFCFFLALSLSSYAASEEVLFKGSFRSLAAGVRVQGDVQILRTADGDKVLIEDFALRGGVVLDLKVCGEAAVGERVCVSVGEPRSRAQSFLMPTSFLSYEKVLIFDLDLIQNLAIAK